MRTVLISQKARERLLELVTLDVYAKRRNLADAQALSKLFDSLYRQLQDDSIAPASIGSPARRAFGLLRHRERRVAIYPFRKAVFRVTFIHKQSIDECEIEAIDLY